jgi:hypothetical protein
MGAIRGTLSALPVLLFSLAIFAFGVLFAVKAYYAMTCPQWPVTQGTVVAFRQTPVYRYAVGGVTNESDVVSCNELLNDNASIRNSDKYSVRYPLGAEVSVHYHPRKANLAVLETQFDRQYLVPIGAVFLLGIAFFAVFCKIWTDKLMNG